MFPSIRKTISFGVWITFHGYGAMRGTQAGRQFAFGSSFGSRSLVSLRAQGCNGSTSPGLRAAEKSPMKWGSGAQSPDRSGLPSAVRGAGPDDFVLRCSRLTMATPPPSGWTWPAAGVEERVKTAAKERAVTIEHARSFFMIRLPTYSGAADPDTIFRPSASVTDLALAIFEPSLASTPITVTSPPTWRKSLVQPSRRSALGLGSSRFQLAIAPLSSFTST